MLQVDIQAPNLLVEEWVQGNPSNIDRERGKVILIEFFQVNCPGCFILGFPEVLEIHQKFQDRPLLIWGLATAFENFDKNNLQNLKKLLSTGEVIGDTFAMLSERGLLNFNRLKYGIPFPVAWDKIVEFEENLDVRAQKIIARDFQNFDELPEPKKN